MTGWTNVDIKVGDALKLSEELASSSIDLIIADPPYNGSKSSFLRSVREMYGDDVSADPQEIQ